jgi:hypothetical protein
VIKLEFINWKQVQTVDRCVITYVHKRMLKFFKQGDNNTRSRWVVIIIALSAHFVGGLMGVKRHHVSALASAAVPYLSS